jgi:hypothetical protein
MNNMMNTEYGVIELNKWFPLYVHNNKFNDGKNTKFENYKIKFLDDDKGCQISGPLSNDIVDNNSGCVCIRLNSRNDYFSRIHCMLASAFPNVKPEYTVDHISEVHTNNRLSNLQWMTLSDNSRKGQAATVEKTNQNGGRNGKWVKMYRRFNDKDDVEIGLFRSIDNAAKTIIRNWDKFKAKETDDEPHVKTVSSKIRRSFGENNQFPYECCFEEVSYPDLEGEIWKTVPHYLYPDQDEGIYEASSRSRFRGPCGLQNPRRGRNSKYTQVSISGKGHHIHRVIYQTFKGKIPENYDVTHDDTAPLDSEGYYRNWLEDLGIAIRSDNMKEHHENKGTKSKMEEKEKLINTSFDVVDAIIKELPLRYIPLNEGDDYIDKLMKNRPVHLEYNKAKGNRGSKFVISRKITPEGKSVISSSGSTRCSDREKFIQIFPKYMGYLKTARPETYKKLREEHGLDDIY